MCSIFLDTNILLDYAVPSRIHNSDARELIGKAMQSKARIQRLYVLASSLKDLYYVFRRTYGSEPDARNAVVAVRGFADIVELTCDICDRALTSDEPDFEDGLIRAAAELVRADVLVTRDVDAFRSSELKVCTAAEALELIA